MQEIYDFLKRCQTYYLATVEGDQPHVRPFGTIHIFEGRLYIQTGKSTSWPKIPDWRSAPLTVPIGCACRLKQ